MNNENGGVSLGTVIGLIYGITGGVGVYAFKGSVATYANLPAGARVGDVYNVIAAYGSYPAGTNFAWDGTTWDALGGSLDLSNYLAKNNTTPFTPISDYNPSTKKYVDEAVLNTVKYLTGSEIYQGIAGVSLGVTDNILCTENYNSNGFNYLVGHIYKVSLDTSVTPNQLVTEDISPCVYNFTNAQMVGALNNGGALKNGDIVICQDTVEGGYVAGNIYYFSREVIGETVQTSWVSLVQSVSVDNITVNKNTNNELQAIALTDGTNVTTASEIRNAISIDRAGVKSLENGKVEYTMAQYEALATVDINTEYDLIDHPNDSITNAQMVFALTCVRLFPVGSTYICQDNGTYSQAHIYQIVETGGVKSWLDMTNSLGYAIRTFL